MDDASDRLGLQLGKQAVERGLLTPGQFREAVAEQKRLVAAGGPSKSLGTILVERGLLSREHLQQLQPDHDTPTRLRGLGQGSGKVGEVKFGKYLIQKRLGKGGAGLVVEAVDTQLDRRVALKLLLPGDLEDPQEAAREEERFMREARLSANLSHPHIVGVYETGVLEGRRYIAMELIEGMQLNLWRKTGAATLRQQMRLLRDVALAVEHAHQAGIIHRDLKPHNILVDPEHQPHVADFGVAKMRRIESNAALTLSGKVVGTPSYMSPEQAEGRKTVDRRTDVWALGVMLYESLTGRTPFKGETPFEIMMKLVKEPVPPPSSMVRSGALDPALERICLKALEKNPVDRFPSARAFADDLTRWLKGKAVQATTKIRKKSSSGAWAAVGAAVLALAATLFFLAWPSSDAYQAELAQAERLLKAGSLDEAEVRFKLILEKAPGNARAVAGRKECARRRGELLRIDVNEGVRLFEARRYPEALAKFGQVLANDPENAEAREYNLKIQRQMEADLLAAKKKATEKPDKKPEKTPAAPNPSPARKPEAAPSSPSLPKPPERAPATRTSLAWVAGEAGDASGLTLTPLPRGRWKQLTHAGRPCVTPLPGADGERLDFTVDSDWARTCGIPEVEIEYLDGPEGFLGIGSVVPEKRESVEFPLTGSGRWRRISVLLSSTAGLHLTGKGLYVHRVTVRPAKPAAPFARPRPPERADRGGLKPGLSGAYFSGTTFDKLLERRVDPKIDFDGSGTKRLEGGKDAFSVRWEGFLDAPRTGLYALRISGDDGVRLFVGEDALVTDRSRGADRMDSGLCRLRKGLHRLKLEYYRKTGRAALRLDCLGEDASGRLAPLKAPVLWHRPEASAAAKAPRKSLPQPPPPTLPTLRGRLKGHRNGVTAVAFSPDGRMLASADYLGAIRIWDSESGSERRVLESPGDPDRVRSLSFSHDGKYLAAARQGGKIQILDPQTGSELSTLSGHRQPVTSVSFSPTGPVLVSTSFDASARLWNVDPAGEKAALGHHAKGASAAAFSPDGRLVAVGSAAGEISVWDAGTGERRGTLPGHARTILSLSYAPDGKTLASSDADGKTHLWDVAAGTLKHALLGHAGAVTGTAFSPDGTVLATSGVDATVRLWDVSTEAGLAALKSGGNGAKFTSVAFSRNGRFLAAGCEDWSVALWDVPVFAAAELNPTVFEELPTVLPSLWKKVAERKAKLVGKSIFFEKKGLPVRQATVKGLADGGLVLELKVSGGLFESPEPLDRWPARTLSDVLRHAFPEPAPGLRLEFAMAFAERGDFKRAYRELGLAREKDADIAPAARTILRREWASIRNSTPESRRAAAREQLLRRRSEFVPENLKGLLN